MCRGLARMRSLACLAVAALVLVQVAGGVAAATDESIAESNELITEQSSTSVDGGGVNQTETEVSTSKADQSTTGTDSGGSSGQESTSITIYTIKLNATENGNVSVSQKTASNGDVITIQAAPYDGYYLSELDVSAGNTKVDLINNGDGSYSFTMVDSAVTISAEFEAEILSSDEETWAISIASTTHGTLKISNSYASEEDWVTVFVDPDDSYEMEEILVLDDDENEIAVRSRGDDTYSFSMPASDVVIFATFTMLEAETTESSEVETTETVSIPFTDIGSSPFKDAIEKVHAAGLMNGVSETTFNPEGTLTRGMIVTTLYRLAGEPAVNGISGYSDVEIALWYSDAVTWATQNGIVNGYTDGTFKPEQAVTREEMAVILYRYASANGIYIGNTFSLGGFTDNADVQPYAKTAMEWAVANSVLASRTTAMLHPGDAATRAEVAQALSTLIQ